MQQEKMPKKMSDMLKYDINKLLSVEFIQRLFSRLPPATWRFYGETTNTRLKKFVVARFFLFFIIVVARFQSEN